MEIFIRVLDSFWALASQMAPYLLLGFIVGGLIHVFIPQTVFKHLGKKGLLSSVKGALFGVPLPLCSCGVVPTSIGLKKKGASDGATVSFLISTPQTGVDSILATYSFFGPIFAVIRPVIAFISGVIGGFLVDTASKDDVQVISSMDKPIKSAPKTIKEVFRYSFNVLFKEVVNYLLIGLVIAALFDVFLPNDFVGGNIATEFELVMILLIAIPLYVCATGSIPIAAVLLVKGFSPGAVFVFLMAGPVTNISSLVLLFKTLGKRTFSIYLGSILFLTLLFGFLINISGFQFSLIHTHDHSHSWVMNIEVISGAILLALIAYYIAKGIIENFKPKKTEPPSCCGCS